MLTCEELARIRENDVHAQYNCVARLLYVCGVIDKKEYVGVGEKKWSEGIVEKYLDTLIKSDSPTLGSIVVIRNKYLRFGQKNFIEHMGLIVEENPWVIHEKPGKNELPHNILLSERLSIYDDRIIEYYSKK